MSTRGARVGCSIAGEVCVTRAMGPLAIIVASLVSAPPLRAPVAVGASALAVGDRHACVVEAGRVLCWGEGRFGQLGPGVARTETPVALPGVRDAVEVAAGFTTSCVRTKGGEVACLGSGYAPMSDAPSVPFLREPARVVSAVAWARGVAVGGERAAVVTASGEVWFFETPSERPIPKSGMDDAAQVAVGWENVCARGVAGNVRCFGPNWGGENGNGGDGEDLDWVDVVSAVVPDAAVLDGAYHGCGGAVPAVAKACESRLEGAVDLAMSGRMGCAALASGQVACWGVGPDEGPLNLGKLGFSRTPLVMPGIADAVEVTVGHVFACARTRGGDVLCWGQNARGELGREGAGSGTPKKVEGLGHVVEVDAGDGFACARDEAGAVRCWGDRPGRGVAPPVP